MSRRLPIYLLLDTSGSMTGEPIAAVQNGVQMVICALRNDPQALESVYLSVITFDTFAVQQIPLTELSQFVPPQLSAGGSTALGEALKLVSDCANREVKKNTSTAKGDWKPMVFIMTDGQATDDIADVLPDFKRRKWGIVVACAAGITADTEELRSITENVVCLDTADTESIGAFFKWVSQSITANTNSVGATNQEVATLEQLPPPPPEITIL